MVKLLGEQDLDYRSIYSDLFFRNGVPSLVKILVNKYANDHNDCLVPPMHFMSLVFKMIQSLQEYKQLVDKK